MSPSLPQGGADSSGLHNIFGSSITSFDVDEISLLKDEDKPSIDEKMSVLSLDMPLNLPQVESYWNMYTMQLNSMKGSLMATISTLPELKVALMTRHPI